MKEIFIERLVHEWNEGNETLFQIKEQDVRWNLNQQNLVQYQLEEIAGVPVLSGTATDVGVELGISAEVYWISLWGSVSPARAEEFLNDVVSNAKLLEKKKVVFGSDEFHFVPGVPLAQPAQMPLLNEMEKKTYDGRTVFDYVGSLESEMLAAYCSAAEKMCRDKKFECRAATKRLDLVALEEFLAKEFPGRWLREFQYWRRSQEENAQISVVEWLIISDLNYKVLGFARIGYGQRASSGSQVPGNLRLVQTGHSESSMSLGPIGSGKDARGLGVGSCLLGCGLSKLRDSGGKSVCIDWTEDHLDKFYLPLGLKKARQFLCRTKTDFS